LQATVRHFIDDGARRVAEMAVEQFAELRLSLPAGSNRQLGVAFA